MRFDGTLKTWNAQRGFGFIAPRQGGQDIFAHLSAFPRDGRVPTEGETLTFEVETTAEGKKRAVRVQRPRQAPTQTTHSRKPRDDAPAHGKSGLVRTLIALGIVAALGWYGYGQYAQRVEAKPSTVQSEREAQPLQATPAQEVSGSFRCDGRQHCSQMTSCAEAKYFLKNCPDTKMDGNHDGVPCEQQWCTSPFSK